MTYGSFVYDCKKTGQQVAIDSIDDLPFESRNYAIRKGLREYFDNYHASETLKSHNGDREAMAKAVAPLVDESYARLVAGDVPGSRAPADPNAAKARQVARQLPDLTDEELEAMVALINKRRAKAGQSAAA